MQDTNRSGTAVQTPYRLITAHWQPATAHDHNAHGKAYVTTHVYTVAFRA